MIGRLMIHNAPENLQQASPGAKLCFLHLGQPQFLHIVGVHHPGAQLICQNGTGGLWCDGDFATWADPA
jgi:hypothetical protein